MVSGEEVAINEVVGRIAALLEYTGTVRWDPSKPNGQQRRWFSNTRARTELNWSPRVPFAEGLKRTVAWYLESRCA